MSVPLFLMGHHPVPQRIPGPFRKLDAIAVLTGPSLPAPQDPALFPSPLPLSGLLGLPPCWTRAATGTENCPPSLRARQRGSKGVENPARPLHGLGSKTEIIAQAPTATRPVISRHAW